MRMGGGFGFGEIVGSMDRRSMECGILTVYSGLSFRLYLV